MSTNVEPPAVPNIGPALGLAPNERIVWSGVFPFSITHFFLETKAALTDKRVAWERPSTLLGLIPIGTQRDSIPLNSIASVSTKTALGIFRLLFGILFILSGLGSIGRSFIAGLIVLAIGVALILSGLQARLTVVNNGGQKFSMYVPVINREKAQQFADQINTTLATNR
jgi:hypothetical protein